MSEISTSNDVTEEVPEVPGSGTTGAKSPLAWPDETPSVVVTLNANESKAMSAPTFVVANGRLELVSRNTDRMSLPVSELWIADVTVAPSILMKMIAYIIQPWVAAPHNR